jgi:hypothetical protein
MERAVSSAGRAPRSQRGGRGFESPTVHHCFDQTPNTPALASYGYDLKHFSQAGVIHLAQKEG